MHNFFRTFVFLALWFLAAISAGGCALKYLTTVVLLLAISSIAMGEVSARVCLADANTPLELADPNLQTDPNVFVYRKIMVGTKLTIIIDSNVPGYWDGGLYISATYGGYGVLSARDYNDITTDWDGSCLEAAGENAKVSVISENVRSGFELFAASDAVAGDWFILDYNATKIGICQVDFYDYNFVWDDPNFIFNPDDPDYDFVWDDPYFYYSYVFSQVRTRDFNQDTKVDFADLALFSLYWLQTDCSDPDWCTGTDLNTDGVVDQADLKLFTDFWLEKTQ